VYNNFASNNGAYRAFSFPNYLSNVSTSVNDTKFTNFQLFSDYYIENASFVRMDNINVGYNFGRVWNDAVGVRVTATVNNAFVITKYSGLDPEISGGIDNNFYPRPRVYSLGVNLDF
jgi:iron complex outermembrane receptor protein